jgi:hypothetical protein
MQYIGNARLSKHLVSLLLLDLMDPTRKVHLLSVLRKISEIRNGTPKTRYPLFLY